MSLCCRITPYIRHAEASESLNYYRPDAQQSYKKALLLMEGRPHPLRAHVEQRLLACDTYVETIGTPPEFAAARPLPAVSLEALQALARRPCQDLSNHRECVFRSKPFTRVCPLQDRLAIRPELSSLPQREWPEVQCVAMWMHLCMFDTQWTRDRRRLAHMWPSPFLPPPPRAHCRDGKTYTIFSYQALCCVRV